MIYLGQTAPVNFYHVFLSASHPIVDPEIIIYFKITQQNIINPMLTLIQRDINHEGVGSLHYCLDIVL